MKKVTGLGGIFLKCRHWEETREWYSKHLGVELETWGIQFNYRDDPHPEAYSILSFFKPDSKYFEPSESRIMINFRVADLDALIKELNYAGIPLIGEAVMEEYGKFAWIMDPEGNKIELWEQSR